MAVPVGGDGEAPRESPARPSGHPAFRHRLQMTDDKTYAAWRYYHPLETPSGSVPLDRFGLQIQFDATYDLVIVGFIPPNSLPAFRNIILLVS